MAIEALCHYVNIHQTDWANHFTYVESMMNNSINVMIGMTPTELLYGTSL
jgi:hypothetical protein